jgi:homoserine kinase
VSLRSISDDPGALLGGGDVVVAGSVANLGGGFDTLGVAVELYLRARIVDVRQDDGAVLKVVKSTPSVTGENAVEKAFALAVARTGRRVPTVHVEVESAIPMAAGLGSSAAATVAGLRVFERVTESLPDSTLLGLATLIEGHADNAAPALFGGLTSVMQRADGDPEAVRWPWPEELRLVVATPAVGLATAKARQALPDVLPRKDAVFNLQRVLALVHALQNRHYDRIRDGVADRWHQPARAALVPLLDEALAIEDPDVLGAFLSGAGPSIALIARRDFARLEQLLRSMYEGAGCSATVRTLGVHQSEAMTGAAAAASVHGRSA